MCGILGIGGPEGPALIERHLADLTHRGPDDQDTWSSPALTLGHRRLSIIGLDRDGRQPMASRSGQSLLVFNGEIYNYLELADELEAQGHPSDRRFDSSVLLEALEAWGVSALAKFNGMFAFAWYRPERGQVLLGRDRWGKKPLFWGTYRGTEAPHLAFSSELRTFARLPGGPPEPDPLGVARYLVYDGMPDERTIYTGVFKVPAASWLLVDTSGRTLDRGRYWDFEPQIADLEPDEAAERAESALRGSLRLRLRSDVPVGLFLSGGLDSALLAALWRSERPDETIRTFTIGFDDSSYDERESARLMAQHVDAEHHEIVLTGSRLEEGLHQVLEQMPEPLADPSIVPTSLLCRFARTQVTVAIGGDGGDELQAGYDPFRAWTAARAMTTVAPGRIWNRLLAAAERHVPASSANMSTKFKLHHFRQGLVLPRAERIQGWMSSFPVAVMPSLLRPELAEQIDLEEVLEPTRRAFVAAEDAGDLQAQIQVWLATYLESSILTKIDRASMMHSLEVRSPFLDPGVAESLAGLPDRLIYRRGRGKQTLRRMARTLLPPDVLRRPKKGLGVPLPAWFLGPLRERMEEAISRSAHSGWFDHEAVTTLWSEHLAGRYDHRKALWSFLISSTFQSSVRP